MCSTDCPASTLTATSTPDCRSTWRSSCSGERKGLASEIIAPECACAAPPLMLPGGRAGGLPVAPAVAGRPLEAPPTGARCRRFTRTAATLARCGPPATPAARALFPRRGVGLAPPRPAAPPRRRARAPGAPLTRRGATRRRVGGEGGSCAALARLRCRLPRAARGRPRRRPHRKRQPGARRNRRRPRPSALRCAALRCAAAAPPHAGGCAQVGRCRPLPLPLSLAPSRARACPSGARPSSHARTHARCRGDDWF